MQLTYELSASIELNNWDEDACVLFECGKEQKDIPSIHSGNCFRIIVPTIPSWPSQPPIYQLNIIIFKVLLNRHTTTEANNIVEDAFTVFKFPLFNC